MKTPPIVYDAGRLEGIRALYGDSCNVLFLSNAALSAMNKAIESMLWPTRWHGGKRGRDLPPIAVELYEELTMNLCTVEALGEAIGKALTMTINVENSQSVSTCCDGGVGTVNPDGSINQPPIYPPPESWGNDFPVLPEDDVCTLAYACWEYGGVILGMLAQLRSILIVVGVVAAIVAGFVPASWAVLLAGGSVASLTAALSSLSAQSMIITNSVTAGESWESDKDSIICGFKNSLTENAVSVENQFLSAMIAVYGNLLAENDVQELTDVLAASALGDWLQDAVFDGGDFAPQNMPADYVCCVPSVPVGATAFDVTFSWDVDMELWQIMSRAALDVSGAVKHYPRVSKGDAWHALYMKDLAQMLGGGDGCDEIYLDGFDVTMKQDNVDVAGKSSYLQVLTTTGGYPEYDLTPLMGDNVYTTQSMAVGEALYAWSVGDGDQPSISIRTYHNGLDSQRNHYFDSLRIHGWYKPYVV